MTSDEDVQIEVVNERRSGEEGDFLHLWHRQIRHEQDGTWTAPYQCDSVERPAGTDAVGLVLHTVEHGVIRVGLRAGLRPALALDREQGVPFPGTRASPRLWEIPAGIVEAGDLGEEGLRRRCSLEALEEMGARVPAEAFEPLGEGFWLSPGVLAERVYLFEARVDPAALAEPTGDGSPMETGATCAWLQVPEALALCRAGQSDAKTEVALTRFAARVIARSA